MDGNRHQVVVQLYAATVTVVCGAIGSLILPRMGELTIGLRVERNIEREGLDRAIHGEAAQSTGPVRRPANSLSEW
jgi:ammonium transporter, Amt family